MSDRQKTPVQRALAACRSAFWAVAMFSLAINLLMLAAPLYMMQVFDRVLASRSIETLIALTVVTAGAFLALALLDIVRSRVLLRISTRLGRSLGGETLSAAVGGALQGLGHGVQGLRDVSQIRNFLTGPGIFALFDAPWTPVFIAVIYLFHPMLGAIAAAGAILLFLLAVLNEFVTRRPLNEATAASIAAMKKAEASVRNADLVEAMGMMPNIVRRWEAEDAQVLALQTRASNRAGSIGAAAKFVRLLLQMAVFGLGGYLAIGNHITAGAVVAVALLTARALAPIDHAIGTWRGLVQSRAAYRRLQEVFAHVAPRPTAMPLPRPQGRLSAERVVHVPPDGESAILKGITFDIEPGQALGIIGPTAAGKSTLARLIVGSWSPTSGHLRLDGADIYSWNREDFGRFVGYLPQDVELFAGSIRENIARFGEVDPDAIVTAAEKAGVHEMILRLPNGYETEIGEGGQILSGGQRQRIALARALLGKPCLLVLDEPNANLDTEGEKALIRTLHDAKAEGTTIVVIAHRPSILEFVDKLLVLRNGLVDMFGTRDEIMERTVARPRPRVAEIGAGGFGSVSPIKPSARSADRP